MHQKLIILYYFDLNMLKWTFFIFHILCKLSLDLRRLAAPMSSQVRNKPDLTNWNSTSIEQPYELIQTSPVSNNHHSPDLTFFKCPVHEPTSDNKSVLKKPSCHSIFKNVKATTSPRLQSGCKTSFQLKLSSFANGSSFVLIMIINTTSRLHDHDSSFSGPNRATSMISNPSSESKSWMSKNHRYRQSKLDRREKTNWSQLRQIIII